jgi:uncharacterized protein YjiS (DUF1127 family)
LGQYRVSDAGEGKMYRYNASDKSGSYFVRPTRTKAGRSLVTRVFDQLFTWLDRSRQRRHLSELDDRLLRDIGLSRADVEHEIALPFWRIGRR